ncbi:MAG TPA: type II toxin-antitoxin system RelE/ParE family toxin [Candidatus Babeliales bacterium]|nr:type II toxin-antitoxin system RelE/ParE family toxin [Candidatus Babeliales bacterium]
MKKVIKKEFIAYKGNKYTIEWFFNDKGSSEAQAYFESLPNDRKKKCFHLLSTMGDRGKIFNEEKFRHEGDQIYVFKPSPDRFFCFFFDGAKVVVTNAYEKKSAKMPPKEKDRALKAKENYITRVKKGTYYD